MTSQLRISLSLALFLGAQKLCAQLAPADDFFNGGAQLYISNNIPAALERVELGLKTYPADEKLKKLEELLKQQQQQQQQQEQQEQQKNQKNPPPKNDENQPGQQSKDGQENKPQPKPKEGGKNQDMPDPKQMEPDKDPKQKPDEKSKDEPPDDKPGAALKPGEMKAEDAKRLLDAQKDGERLLQLKPAEKPRNRSHPVKDW